MLPVVPSSAREYALRLSMLFTAYLLSWSVAEPAWPQQRVPGRMILKLDDSIDVDVFAAASAVPQTHVPELDAINAQLDVKRFARLFPLSTKSSKATSGVDMTRFFVVDFSSDLDLESVRSAYQELETVEVAEFDWMHRVNLEPNDFNPVQWYIESSVGMDAHITGGWNHSTGDTSVVLAIADSGIDWQHPDLGGDAPNYTNGNIWINWEEFHGTAGVDDDNNGYIDDIRGWDFVSFLNNAWPGEDAMVQDNDPRDFNGHGTHVGGIASAITDNGQGVAGIGWNCKIMALRIGGSVDIAGNEEGVVLMSNAASAIDYARAMGAVAVNCSWGSSFTLALDAAVDQAVAAGMSIVVAAGNNNENSPSYLGTRGDCIDVAASTGTDAKASFSNFGGWVDITAPGVGMRSTYFNHNATGAAQHTYATRQGTSMAAPVITGVVGLLRAHNPAFRHAQVKFWIDSGADNIDAANPSHIGLLGAGRVNLLKSFGDRFLTVPDDYPSLAKAFAASADYDTVAVKGGQTITSPLFVNQNHRYLLGGYDATYTNRNPDNPTILNPTANSPVAEFINGITDFVMDGFHLSTGVARNLASPAGKYGGGILCTGASPLIRNCRIDHCVAGGDFETGGGGGALLNNSSPRFENCTFSFNVADEGAGVYVLDSTVEFIDCQFSDNSVFSANSAKGTGMFVTGSSQVTVTGGSFLANLGGNNTGGLLVEGAGASVSIDGVLFDGNTSENNGGNLRADGATLNVMSSVIRNGSSNFGAGINLSNNASLDLRSSVLHANQSNFVGGGIYAVASNGVLLNVTFDANDGGLGGADAVSVSSPPSPWTLHNSIVSNHTNATALDFNNTSPDLDYNLYWNNSNGDLSGGDKGANSSTMDPHFVDNAAGDHELGLHSPALDSGNPDISLADKDGSRNNRGAFGGPAAVSRAPGFPTGVTAVFLDGVTTVTWLPNPEPDVDFYAIYRGVDADFAPSLMNFVGTAQAAESEFVDDEGTTGDWYVLSTINQSGAASGFSIPVETIEDATDSATSVTPKIFALEQNYPNPFNPTTTIRFHLAAPAFVRLDVYDGRGRRVRRLLAVTMEPGKRSVVWDGRDDSGKDLGSGVYVYRLIAADFEATRKMTLLR